MTKTRTVARLGLLLAIALGIQSLHLPTFITGPAINAVLIVAVAFPSVWGSLFLGCITPLAAFFTGLVHPVTAPLVPVIMAANATLGITFYLLRKRNDYLALTGAAIAKYLVFHISVNYLVGILNIKIPAPILVAFQLPQLFTALIGGIFGVAIIKSLEKIYHTNQEKISGLQEEILNTEEEISNTTT